MSDVEVDADVIDTGTPDPQTVTRAREMGWVPETEWKGTPPKNGFLDPAEFVRRGEKIMPIVRAENKKLQERLDRLEREREAERGEHRDTIKRIERMSALGVAQARKQIEDKYADRIDAAAEVGDKAAVRQIRKEEKEAIAAMDEQVKDPEPDNAKSKAAAELPKAVTDIIDAWKADNKWFSDNDPSDEMTAYATAVHMKLQKEKKGLTLKENLEEVSARVRKRFPEQFGDAGDDEADDDKPVRSSRVEGGSRMNGGGSASLWSKLPADAKTQGDRFIKDELLFLDKGETVEKDLAKARERYATKYLENDK